MGVSSLGLGICNPVLSGLGVLDAVVADTMKANVDLVGRLISGLLCSEIVRLSHSFLAFFLLGRLIWILVLDCSADLFLDTFCFAVKCPDCL